MEETKNLDYYRNNAEEDYITTPISVLRYISELETKLGVSTDEQEENAFTGRPLHIININQTFK